MVALTSNFSKGSIFPLMASKPTFIKNFVPLENEKLPYVTTVSISSAPNKETQYFYWKNFNRLTLIFL
jgi:hypothetical protein